jgi:hypothetical protein
MRHRSLVFAVCVIVGVTSCKRSQSPRKAPDEHADQAAAVQPAVAQALPATRPGAGSFSHLQLLRFIRASRQLVATAGASGRTIEPLPEGFAALAQAARIDPAIKAALAGAHMSADEWADVGETAWRAWGVAQVDYNAEAPLRQNAADLAAARHRLASAEAAVKSGFPILSEEERTQRITKAQDEATTAMDRATTWSESAQRLRTQIAEAEASAAEAEGGTATGGTATGRAAQQGQDDAQGAAPAAGLPADGASGSGSTPQTDPAVTTAAQEQTAQAARVAIASWSQELTVAERNQQDEQEHAQRASLAAEHPDLPRDDVERMDMMRQATLAIEQSKADIQKREEESKLLSAWLQDERRVSAAERQKTAPPADVNLLRRHLAEFNDAWGMTVEGRPKPPEQK